jgi:hypothetical protein
MTNELGDRHVLAAAVRSQSELIVTYNRRHFPAASLQPWDVEVQGPSSFLHGLYELDPGLFVSKLHEAIRRLATCAASARPAPSESRPEKDRPDTRT